MFDGVPDQFHQFIGGGAASSPAIARSAAATTLLLPLSFTSSNGFTSFDPLFTSSSSSSNSHHHPPQFLQSLKNNEDSLVGMSMEINERDERSMAEPIDNIHHPWSDDEVLSLLRIRSSTETWFPEFTWEHVSRKLAELGFKRSAEKCKEKFEEESRYFNTMNCSKNYRIFSELEELCQAENPPPQHHRQVVGYEKPREEEDNIGQNLEGDELYQTSPANNNAAISSDRDNKNVVENKRNGDDKANRKRKRMKKLEMFKGFCEEIVNKLMIQQEETHSKLLEDMVKRDEEKVAREAAWKQQELDRINQELELRAKEHAIAGDRQATIIKFLTKFSQNGSSQRKCSNPPLAASLPVAQNPNPIANAPSKVTQNPKPNQPTPQNPNPPNPTSNDREDLGKRWPRDEVSALINLRCSLYNNANGEHDKEGGAIKAPLWERISQGMLDLGYKRSAKRCKEKWENINKYFRKTKDVNKKRSLDSRTCPYFHQLSTLYSRGTLTSPSSQGPEMEADDTAVQVSQGDETNNIVQLPGLEFEF